MIQEYEFYHGIVFLQLLKEAIIPLCIRPFSEARGSYYVVHGNKFAGLFIKHSTKRLSPWRFTFDMTHQDEIRKMKERYGEAFLVLVCDDNGVVVLNFDELKNILDHNHEPTEWISVARGKREMFTVKGSDGELDYKIGKSDFPKKILDYLNLGNPLALRKLQDNLRSHSLG